MVSNSVSNKAQDHFFALKCFMLGAPHLVWVFLILHEAKGMCSFELASISDVMLLHLLLHSLSTLVNTGLDTCFNRGISQWSLMLW